MRFFYLILISFLAVFSIVVSASELPRVVSLSPSLTEAVYHLGRGSCLIGRSDACDYPPAAAKVSVAGKFADPHLETIFSLRPDLLITNALINPGVVKTLEKAGIKAEVIPGETIEQYRAGVSRLGKLLQAEEAAAREVARIDAMLQEKPTPLPIKVLWMIWDTPPMVGGKNSLPDALIQLTGAENLAGKVDQPYFKCSFEWLLENQPDVIVWCTHDRDISTHRFWKQLRAVKQGRVISDINPDVVLRPGPRLMDGVKQLQRRLATIAEDIKKPLTP